MEPGFYVPSEKLREMNAYLCRVVADWEHVYCNLYPFASQAERQNAVNSLKVIKANINESFSDALQSEVHYLGKKAKN